MAGTRIDWDMIARRLNYDSARVMWQALYVTQGLSIAAIAHQFAVAPNSIRGALADAGMAPRGRGGSNNVGKVMPPEFLEVARKEGTLVAAKQFNVSRSMVYKRLARARREEEASQPSPEPLSTPGPAREEGHEESS